MFEYKEPISRRSVVKGLLSLTLMVGGVGCSSSGSVSTPTPTATATPRSLGKIIYSYQGHSARVTTVAWSSDGKRVASGSVDKTVQVWDAFTGTHAITSHGHTDIVNAVAWSPDSTLVASVSLDKTAQLWNPYH